MLKIKFNFSIKYEKRSKKATRLVSYEQHCLIEKDKSFDKDYFIDLAERETLQRCDNDNIYNQK